MSPNLIGQTLLNQFRVDAFIATGGMGAVYRVWDLKRNVPLAMKVLHSDLAEDPSVFKRFKREANALKKLAHPNIVPFYGLYQTKDFAFLLERYVDGPSLKEIIREHLGKPIPINEVLIYTKALSAALGYAHANGVVHCDVKPGNVMVDRGGNIYLTDFGIARHAESTVTTLATAGTGAYMAPEQIRGEPVSPATDVYALGALLFEMLTGRKLFTGDEKDSESSGSTVGERIRFGHLQLPPPDPRSYNPALPEALAQVITKALKKQPNQRYPSVHELYEELCNSISVSSGSIPDRAKIQEDSWENDQGFTEKGEMKKHRRLPWVITIIGLFIIGILALAYSIFRGKYPIHIGKESENQTTELAAIYSSNPSATVALIKTILPTATFLHERTPTPLLSSRTSTPQQRLSSISTNDGAVMIFIPSGEFLMGLNQDDIKDIVNMCPNCDPSELVDVVPQRKIYLDSYWIDQKEVTNKQFSRFVASTSYQTNADEVGSSYVFPPFGGVDEYIKGANWRHPFGISSDIATRDLNPVVQVSWEDANAYCKWAGRRLPTEAEWEKAARGDQGWLFPWGNTPPASNLLNFNHENYGPLDVGSYPQGISPYGLFDMAGNVWEWVSDFYLESYYQNMPDQNPIGPSSGDGHPFRGGSWASDFDGDLYLVTTAYRLWNYPYIRSNVIGFRCAMDANDTLTPGFEEIHFCNDRNCLTGTQTIFPQGTKEVYFSYDYQNMKPNTAYGRRWYVNGNLYLDYSCTWGQNWPTEGLFLKKVYDYDYGLAPGEWRLETYIDDQLQATATFTVQGPIRYENFLEGYSCNDTSPILP
jgi:formylglycine-generating enzyme required for sulfatase activity/predicted Ser/Thr protein kinase